MELTNHKLFAAKGLRRATSTKEGLMVHSVSSKQIRKLPFVTSTFHAEARSQSQVRRSVAPVQSRGLPCCNRSMQPMRI